MSKELYSGEFYEKINLNNYYFVDKTRMISTLIGNWHSVFVIPRPRGFGKCLNLSMVKNIFEKTNNDISFRNKKK